MFIESRFPPFPRSGGATSIMRSMPLLWSGESIAFHIYKHCAPPERGNLNGYEWRRSAGFGDCCAKWLLHLILKRHNRVK